MFFFDERQYTPRLSALKARQSRELQELTEYHAQELQDLPGRRAKNLLATLQYRADKREERRIAREEEQQRQEDFAKHPEEHICKDCGKQSVDVQLYQGDWFVVVGPYCPDCYEDRYDD